ncbi:Na+/H+ antiporter NhaC family protein [Marinisporobacter balticus]|uniref:Transporter (NhaC family) n=1 Tax=Marinisporobacter balticus TaxID=2018667 RepID=A0A4R2KGR9_9FIRM|nr:Na+/H+ antiporter NhaC family protein [Marinisporobacter balticus]TCO71497.1 transporter (NhaC family) [Marinisporobacter balticus]
MEVGATMGIISLLPATIAIILAFRTRNTVFSLAVAIFIGVLVAGKGLMGFPTILKTSLGTTSFSWILLLELFIGIVIAFFQRTGAIQGFTKIMEDKKLSRKNVQLTAWVMGMFVFFSDYFSPLFVGSTMRSLSDKARISREKLAYIADSTSAPVSVLAPITGWAVFISGLLVGMGPVENAEQAMMVFTRAVPFNFYAIIAVILVGLFAVGVIPDFGPMKKAEKRALEEGKVLRDGAEPLIGEELTDTPSYEGIKTHIFFDFIFPVLIVVTIAIGTFITLKSAKTMEAFLTAAVVLGIIMRIQGVPFNDIMKTAMSGMKGVMPAIIILALSYTINALSKEMGTANYIISVTESWLTPNLLPLITFLIAATISFSTGTSWGTFAIVMPIAAPLAFNFSGNEVTVLVLATVSAVAGGGVFGDHCSPLSDTTILASTGAAADHIDHVKTQIPYALVAAGVAAVVYLIIGFVAV